MSDENFFGPPPFDPAAGLQALRRSLRDLHQLSQRGGSFVLRGRDVIDFALEGATIRARLAQQPALTPQWEDHTLRSSADARRFLDEVRKRLARWSDE